MTDRCETVRDCRTTIASSFLKVSNLCTIPCGFCESPNKQNWMCELCTFSQIWSHYINTVSCYQVDYIVFGGYSGKKLYYC